MLGGTIEPASVAAIHSQSEGVPFIVEELVRPYREAGLLQQIDGTWRLSRNAAKLVPSAVRTLIQRRAGRLARDTRVDHPGPPYFEHPPRTATRTGGDVLARFGVMHDEVTDSVRLIGELLDAGAAGGGGVLPGGGGPPPGLAADRGRHASRGAGVERRSEARAPGPRPPTHERVPSCPAATLALSGRGLRTLTSCCLPMLACGVHPGCPAHGDPTLARAELQATGLRVGCHDRLGGLHFSTNGSRWSWM